MNYQTSRLAPGLYIVSTPIGTARDITLRALDTLASCDILVAEDTRSLKHLLAIHGIALGTRPVWSYHDHSDPSVRERIIGAIAAGSSVAYAAEAGTPMVSDPGFALARDAERAGQVVTAVPGASAVLTALTLSGLPTDRFLFLGFLPAKAAARRAAIAEVADIRATLVLYESPKRVQGLLGDLAQALGENREAALCRELTKRFEEVLRLPLGALIAALSGRVLKGECVVVLAPPDDRPEPAQDDLRMALMAALKSSSVRDAATEVAARFGVPRKGVYQLALDIAGQTGGDTE
ncbi:MAG: 16S rRNA (cytidine(1402)-2'-O)-methyltransferase [Rhodobacteraceae bacterium]|nr:16S rRNA (cytidine(1402)-2'-O)-methyltransferase [Paracoccaceae bacterium]